MSGFEALEISGSEDFLRGFVAGWAAGLRIDAVEIRRRVLWAREWDVRLGDRGWLSFLQEPVQGLLVREDTVDPLLEALRTHGGGSELRFHRHVEAARFEFEFEIFGRKEALQVRSLFGSMPQDVEVRDYETDEKVDPEAQGIELHGALHPYVFSGKGTVVGKPGPVLALHERARQHERIRLRDITLELSL